MVFNKAVIRMTSGRDYTLTGDSVGFLARHFATVGSEPKLPLGWISGNGRAINLQHAENIDFFTEKGSD